MATIPRHHHTSSKNPCCAHCLQRSEDKARLLLPVSRHRSQLCLIEDLVERFPPRRRASFAALRSRNQALRGVRGRQRVSKAESASSPTSFPPNSHQLAQQLTEGMSTPRTRLLITVSHGPPFANSRVLAHPGHVALEIDARVSETRKEQARLGVVVDHVCAFNCVCMCARARPRADLWSKYDTKRVAGSMERAGQGGARRLRRTIVDVTFGDLFLHFGPAIRVTFLVGGDTLRSQADDGPEALLASSGMVRRWCDGIGGCTRRGGIRSGRGASRSSS